jgi:fructose-specific component phosphotransferase system IIB-like protein
MFSPDLRAGNVINHEETLDGKRDMLAQLRDGEGAALVVVTGKSLEDDPADGHKKVPV